MQLPWLSEETTNESSLRQATYFKFSLALCNCVCVLVVLQGLCDVRSRVTHDLDQKILKLQVWIFFLSTRIYYSIQK